MGGEHFSDAASARKHYEASQEVEFSTEKKKVDKIIDYADIVRVYNDVWERGAAEKNVIKKVLTRGGAKTINDALKLDDYYDDSPTESRFENFAREMQFIPEQDRSRIYAMPLEDLPALLNIHKDKPYAKATLSGLLNIYEAVKKNDPNWSPKEIHGELPRFGWSNRDDEATRIQQMSSASKELVERFISDRWPGREKEFWSTVVSKSANYPTFADFFKAVKNFA